MKATFESANQPGEFAFVDLLHDPRPLRRDRALKAIVSAGGSSAFALESSWFIPLTVGPGTRLGPYEITALLGMGGMGEVYRATDSSLKRQVAIKVLPAAVAGDPDRLARFQREAEVLAALNHPNIAHIYGLEKSDGTISLVMELVEGPTLADRIAKGPISIDEALPIAKQIAEALEAAHEHGIVHRDLKPANVKVRDDGTVKVLDFGLAKATEPPGVVPNVSHSPTITTPAMTQAGVILGTAAYMSPEQAKGRPADKRSDVWAFGCVLYEMLTGQRAFAGEDLTETLAAVLKTEPDWAALPSPISPAILTLLKRCLAKRSGERLGSVSTVLFVLQEQERLAPSTGAVPAPPAVRAPFWRSALVPTVTLLVGGAVAGGATWVRTRQALPAVTRTMIGTTPATALRQSIVGARDLAITPDGSRVAYEGSNRILARPLDQLEATELVGANDPNAPFASPDGQWVGYFEGRLFLNKVAMTGGGPVRLCATGGAPGGATWGDDGTIVFAMNNGTNGLRRVSAAGGDPEDLAKPDGTAGELGYLWPEFLPGGKAVLFTITSRGGSLSLDSRRQVAVLDLRTGTRKVLIRGGSHAHYVSSGHLVYGFEGTLRAVPFDLARLEVVGTPLPAVSRVRTSNSGAADFDVARNGTLVYVDNGTSGGSSLRKLVWVDRQGREQPLRAPDRAFVYPRISPDGKRVALSIRDAQDQIWVWDFARETLTLVTSSGVAQYPVWTRDSRRLIFGSEGRVVSQPADGAGAPAPLTPENRAAAPMPYAVSPDGSQVVIREGAGTYDLGLLSLSGDHRTEPLVHTRFSELNAEISPNGNWLAYESDESGQREVYVRPFPDVDSGRWPVSNGGGTRPLWARNGQELFYVTTVGDGPNVAVMSVKVDSGTVWNSGTPTKLFEGRYFQAPSGIGEGRTYDVASDGGRFLMIKDADQGDANLVVVQHFDQELKRLVPVK